MADRVLDYVSIGCRVREFRKRKGMTQEKLAEAAELSVPYMSHIELGSKKGSLATFVRLADAPDVSVDAILLGFQSAEIDMQRLLDDCSQQERQVLFQITAAVKEILRDAA